MCDIYFKRRVFPIFIMAAALTTIVSETCPCEENKDKHITTVRARDIPQRAQILGSLDHPLGSLLTIRGKWVRPDNDKDDSLLFHVDLVNGTPLKESVNLHSLQVNSILTHRGRKPRPGERWDWHFARGGTEPPPSKYDGEIWEMMGVETGRFDSYSDEAWKEIGIPDQAPAFANGFYTRFEYIAVRKVKQSK